MTTQLSEQMYSKNALLAGVAREKYRREAAAAGTLFALSLVNPVIGLFGIPFFLSGIKNAYDAQQFAKNTKKSLLRV